VARIGFARRDSSAEFRVESSVAGIVFGPLRSARGQRVGPAEMQVEKKPWRDFSVSSRAGSQLEGIVSEFRGENWRAETY
jgi:hypothetical protein